MICKKHITSIVGSHDTVRVQQPLKATVNLDLQVSPKVERSARDIHASSGELQGHQLDPLRACQVAECASTCGVLGAAQIVATAAWQFPKQGLPHPS